MSDAGNEVWGGMLPELPAPANIDVDIPEFSPMCTRAEATELIEERLGPLIARLDQHENRIAQLENEVFRLQHENANLRRVQWLSRSSVCRLSRPVTALSR